MTFEQEILVAANTESSTSNPEQTGAIAISGWRLPGAVAPGERAGTPIADRGPRASRAIMPLFGANVTKDSEPDHGDNGTKNRCPPPPPPPPVRNK